MDAKTAKEAILDALEDLGKTELMKFCSSLRGRKEEPRIRRSEIEDASRIEIADKIVTTFTENDGVEVTLNILKNINCKDVAQELENWRERLSKPMDQLDDCRRPIRTCPVNPAISGYAPVSTYDPKAQLKKCKEFEQTYNEAFQHNKKQVVTTEKQIRAEIEKLHQLLREEEEKRVSALKEEEKQKAEIVTREMKNIQEQISSLSDQISQEKPNVSFIIDEYTLSAGPRSADIMLIDVDKHLGNLAYRVCEEIKQKVPFSPVILDPNTANGYLSLSEDLTSVSHTETIQQLPDTPERFTMYPSVLGSEGFSSGTHTWEVEVGDNPRWDIGYVQKSVNRKGLRPPTPRNGTWCLRRHRSMEYSNGLIKFSLQRNPHRIRIQLDYDEGKVSFYDTEDMSLIYTHKYMFREKLYPYLNYEKVGDAETTDISICKVAQACPTSCPGSGSCQRGVALLTRSCSTQTLPQLSQTLPKPSCKNKTFRDYKKLKCVLQ